MTEQPIILPPAIYDRAVEQGMISATDPAYIRQSLNLPSDAHTAPHSNETPDQ